MTKQLFNEITEWQDKTFPESTSMSKIAHLSEELMELAESIENADGSDRHEFADCFILLMGAAKANGMTYEDCIQAIQEKFGINKLRQWGEPDEDGVVRHVEEEQLPENLTTAVAGAYLHYRKKK